MIDNQVEQQANMYVFELNNSAKEHWFKAGEAWELTLANDAEQIAIEKKYKPTHSAKGLPETLLKLHSLVKAQLLHQKFDTAPDQTDTATKDKTYLVAYNPDRLR